MKPHHLALHLLLLLGSALLLKPADAQSPALQVCVSARPPFVLYNATTKAINGYEWDLFTLVATALSLNFTTRVLPWDTMMSALKLPPSDPDHCDIAPSAIPLTFPISSAPGNLKFSIPTFRSGYSIATAVEWDPFDMWSFGRVFSVELWAALISSAVGLAVLAYLAERDFTARGLGKTKYPVPLKPGMYEALYNCVGKLFNIVQDLRVTSLPGKLISLAWGFQVLVVISMYTAVVAALLTATTSVTKVQGLADLKSGLHTAIAADTLVNNFTKLGFTPRGVPFGTPGEQLAALGMVASGAADALVAEYPWLRYQVQSRCDLVIVDSMFKYVSNVILFSPSMTDTLVYQVDSQLTYQQAEGMYEILQAAYIKSQNTARCTSSSYVITLKQLEGLWYIMIAFVGLAGMILVLPRLSKRFELDTALSRSASISSMARSIGKSGRSFVDKVTKRSHLGNDSSCRDPSSRSAVGGELSTRPTDLHDSSASNNLSAKGLRQHAQALPAVAASDHDGVRSHGI